MDEYPGQAKLAAAKTDDERRAAEAELIQNTPSGPTKSDGPQPDQPKVVAIDEDAPLDTTGFEDED